MFEVIEPGSWDISGTDSQRTIRLLPAMMIAHTFAESAIAPAAILAEAIGFAVLGRLANDG